MSVRSVLLAAAVLACAACEPAADSPLGVARRFADAYYVRIDLPAARGYCTGLAAHKLAEELRLTAGQAIDASTRKPRIRYRLLEQRPSGDAQVSFLFEGSVEVEDAGTDKRQWLITTRREGGSWKVSNFVEFEEGGA